AAAGWQKQDIQDFIFQHPRLLRREGATVGKRAIVDRGGGPQQEFRALREPADLLVVAAGGPAGGFGAIIPPWLGSRSQAVTHVIDEGGTGGGPRDGHLVNRSHVRKGRDPPVQRAP